MGAGATARHWDTVYATRGSEQVSWAQRDPGPSLAAVDALEVDHTDAVIDVGGGTSAFAGALAQRGFTDITVLDLSVEAINGGINRYGADRITWQLGDVLDWGPEREYGLWHDRAVFHFLTDATNRQRYLDALDAAVAPGGAIIIETFAPEGPDHCSGLPVARYSPAALAHELGAGLALVASGEYEHSTPAGAGQAFIWLALRKIPRNSSPRA
jgi:2-polyprenyl-3-methyl-5-hydroxy-6-metoxy-1,4-benzoquinol methylase